MVRPHGVDISGCKSSPERITVFFFTQRRSHYEVQTSLFAVKLVCKAEVLRTGLTEHVLTLAPGSRDLLDGLWGIMRDDIAASRKLTPEAVDAQVNGIRAALAASGGDAAQAALKSGLVDRFSTRDEWRARLIEAAGKSAEGNEARTIDFDQYLAVVSQAEEGASDSIAVIVAQGTIVDGAEPMGVVAGVCCVRRS